MQSAADNLAVARGTERLPVAFEVPKVRISGPFKKVPRPSRVYVAFIAALLSETVNVRNGGTPDMAYAPLRSNGLSQLAYAGASMPSKGPKPMSKVQGMDRSRGNAAAAAYACSTINTIMAVAMTARKLSSQAQRRPSGVRPNASAHAGRIKA